MDRVEGGHTDRPKVSRLLQRLGRHPVDAPARVQPAGPRPAGRRARRAGRRRVEGGDLGGGKRARAACGGYVCFEDEAGFTRRPPRGRTWGRRGRTPVVTVSGRRSGRLSVAGLIEMRPGSRTRLCHRLRSHRAGKSTRRSMGERDFIALLDGVHQLIKAPIVLVWDRLNTHVSRRMRELVAEREWLSVFLLPAYSPDLNPVEGVWAHVKRSLTNLAVMALDRLETLVRNRLKRLQYRPHTLDGFIAGTGLTLDDPTSP
ncbi:IS630 family transposase [Streptomyces chryseus]|uniref:IS630 family transposase n=1 Tax=Streptomyces chryseus TaxID=68186 RepID=UPI00201319D2